jgi:hypothetical protein
MVLDFDKLEVKAKRIDEFNTILGVRCGTGEVRHSKLFSTLNCQTLEIKNFHGESIQCAYQVFHRCKELKHLIFNNASLPNVDAAADFFGGCNKLAKIDIIGDRPLLPSNRQSSKMFAGTRLERIDINDFVGSKDEQVIETFEMMFAYIETLRETNLDNLCISPKLEILEHKFQCSDISVFDGSPKNIKINLPNDRVTRQVVLKCLLQTGWCVDSIVENCTLEGKPVDFNTVLSESAENIKLD